MKGRLIALDHVQGREAAALMVDGRLDDILIETDKPRPGTIYRATADRPLKGQGGMTLNTPDGTAFLRHGKGIAPGDALLVQVTGYAEDGKAVPVTSKVLFKSRYAIVTPNAPGRNISRSIRDDGIRDQLAEIAHEAMGDRSYGLILRSSCANADAEDIAEDITAMVDLADQVMGGEAGAEPEVLLEGDGPHVVAWREWTAKATVETAQGSFEDHGVLDALEELTQPKVSLGSSGSMYVEPTRAMVAVDVNTGNDTSMAAGLKTNLAVAKELPRQLRTRGLGGQIVLDLAPMQKKERRTFESALRGALRNDPMETALVGWTPLGHFELQRKRERVALSEVLK